MTEVTVIELNKMASLFNLSIDENLKSDDNLMPKEVGFEDKSSVEQMQLIQQIDEDDKKTIFKLIDKMLTNKKFKDFFQKNIVTL